METVLTIFHQELMTQAFVESTCSAVVLIGLVNRTQCLASSRLVLVLLAFLNVGGWIYS